jgi:hypothetical protein
MADNYDGRSLVVKHNTVDISGTARSVKVTGAAGEPPDVDHTHKGDTTQVIAEGIPRAVKTNVELSVLDETGNAAAATALVLNAKDTLTIYPEGVVHGKQKITLTNARLISRSHTTPYDNVAEVSMTFHAKNTATYTTYSSA